MGLLIPHDQLSQEALRGVLESFVDREGTDYGTQPVEYETKLAQVRAQLDRGEALLLYDEETGGINIVSAHAYRLGMGATG